MKIISKILILSMMLIISSMAVSASWTTNATTIYPTNDTMNVGIGTTNSFYKLTVLGSVFLDNVLTIDNGKADIRGATRVISSGTGYNTNSAFSVQSNGATWMTIFNGAGSSGFKGAWIGLTSEDDFYLENYQKGAIRLITVNNNNNEWERLNIGNNGNVKFNRQGRNDFNLTIAGDTDSELFYAGNNDKVGIGTNAPSTKLDVNGDVHISANTTLDVLAGPGNAYVCTTSAGNIFRSKTACV